MYKKIAKQPTVMALYAEKLIKEGTVKQSEYEVKLKSANCGFYTTTKILWCIMTCVRHITSSYPYLDRSRCYKSIISLCPVEVDVTKVLYLTSTPTGHKDIILL
jgi:hypothetical protein